ncbi:AAA family ATPase [Bradyrhizobium symbiodeficiens]|uniref:AAA family ATPase n=1 Tax=Bradyrhizobium symbiodeficiens TaxID=1404367 RepID=UPI0030CC9FCE
MSSTRTFNKDDFDAVRQEVVQQLPRFQSLTGNLTVSNVKPTPWLVVGYALRGAVTVFAAKGGTGKTQSTLQAAISFALGKNYLHFQLNVGPGEFLRTAFVSGEESLDEIQRRVLAICIHHCSDEQGNYERQDVDGLLQKLKDRLFIYVGKQVALVARGPEGRAERTSFHAQLMADAIARHFDMVVLDPSIRLHEGLDENSAEIQELHNAADNVAEKAHVGVVIVSHMRKSTSESVEDQHSARGHSSTTDGARIVLQAAGMSAPEAEKLIPRDQKNRHRYVKFGDPKQSYTTMHGTTWLKKVTVPLPVSLENGNQDSRFVLETVVFDQQALTDEQAKRILLRIKDGNAEGRPYTDAADGRRICRADAMVASEIGSGLRRARDVLQSLVEAGQIAVQAQAPDKKNPARRMPRAYTFKSWNPVEQPRFAFEDEVDTSKASSVGDVI